MVELSTKPKEVKKDEKILPAKLPAVWIRHVLQQCLDAFIQLVTLKLLNYVTSIIIELRLFLLKFSTYRNSMHCCLRHLFNNARLAPRRMKEEEVEGDKSVSGESSKSQEAVKKDVNKMNIKELKVWALRWVGKKFSCKLGVQIVTSSHRCSNVFFCRLLSLVSWYGQEVAESLGLEHEGLKKAGNWSK